MGFFSFLPQFLGASAGTPLAISGTIAPAAAANTDGAPFTVTPPAGFSSMAVVHIGLSNFGVAAETVQTTCAATAVDNTTQSNNNTYTSNTGDQDNQHFIEPAWGITAASGQNATGAGKRCKQLVFTEQSTIPSSLASQTIRVQALCFP